MGRNRSRPRTSLEERLLKFAEEARFAADRTEPTRQREALIDKARNAETMAGAAQRLKE